MTGFADLASVKTKDMPDVVLLPNGCSFYWRIPSRATVEEKDYNDQITVLCRCEGAIENIEDEEALEEYRKKVAPATEVGEKRVVKFWWPKLPNPNKGETQDDVLKNQAKTKKRMLKFLVGTLGIDDEGGDKSFPQMFDEIVNARFIGTIKHEADWRNPREFNDVIDETASLNPSVPDDEDDED